MCTIGGNVAENSGGAHCLKYGFTTNHVLGLTFVTATGDVVTLGGNSLDSVGPDLRAVVVGSEGTLGIVTEVVVRLLRKPKPSALSSRTSPTRSTPATPSATSSPRASSPQPSRCSTGSPSRRAKRRPAPAT